MPLDTKSSHPSSHSYVLKLHRDAAPQAGVLFGRLESLSSGRCFAFSSAEELLQCLSRDALATQRDASSLPPDRN